MTVAPSIVFLSIVYLAIGARIGLYVGLLTRDRVRSDYPALAAADHRFGTVPAMWAGAAIALIWPVAAIPVWLYWQISKRAKP